MPEEVQNAPDAVPCPPFSCKVTFENVSFGYLHHRPVLKDVSPSTRQCRGPAWLTGSSKTTIINLLMRFTTPAEGASS